jgi:hypothetical protein
MPFSGIRHFFRRNSIAPNIRQTSPYRDRREPGIAPVGGPAARVTRILPKIFLLALKKINELALNLLGEVPISLFHCSL